MPKSTVLLSKAIDNLNYFFVSVNNLPDRDSDFDRIITRKVSELHLILLSYSDPDLRMGL